MKIPLVELFYSIQGEPYSIGKPVVFLRFPGCTLACKWCDTKYASRVQKAKWKHYSPQEVVAEITKYPTNIVVFTGGEPLLYKKEIMAIIDMLNALSAKIYIYEIETNGTLEPFKMYMPGQFRHFYNGSTYYLHYNVSPKLASSGNPENKRIKTRALKRFLRCNSLFKFVIKTKEDWYEMEELIKKIKIPRQLVWVMPCSTTNKEWVDNALKLVDKIKKQGYNLAPRLQILLWNKKRGV